jgi:hypothetical protein
VGVGSSSYRSFQVLAGQLFVEALPVLTKFSSPRAWAFGLIGIHEYLRRLSGDSFVRQTRESLILRLMDVYDRAATPDWPWFEQELSYDNVSAGIKQRHSRRFCSWEAAPLAGTRYALYMSF